MKIHQLILPLICISIGIKSFGQEITTSPISPPSDQDLENTIETHSLHYTISGKIENVEDVNVYLTRWSETGVEIINTGRLINGEFIIKGSIAVPENFTLRIGEDDGMHSISIFLGGDNVSITANYDNLHQADISGAPLNQEANNYFNTHYFNYRDYINDSGMDNLNMHVSEFNDGSFSPGFIAREKSSLFQYVEEHPASPVSPFLVLQSRIFFSLDYHELQALDAYYENSLNQSPDLIMLRQTMSMLEPVSVGKKFTDFTLPDTSGSFISISDYEGQNILLHFWASECGLCTSKFPALRNTHQKYADEGFTIIGVSFDTNIDHWKRAILNEQVNWVHLSAPEAQESDIGKHYVIGEIPVNILIGPDGTIIARNVQSFELNKKLAEIFGF